MTNNLSPVWPVQEAIAAAVEGDSALQALLTPPGIYDVMPGPQTPYPYITFGFTTEIADPFSVFHKGGTLTGQQLDIWTNLRMQTGAGTEESGMRVGKLIYARVRALFHQRPLTVAGFRVTLSNITLTAILPDPDGETVHGIVRYDVTAREA